MPANEGALLITQLSYFASHSYWDAQGDKQSQAAFKKWEIQPYAEYGLTDKITIGGSAFFQRDSQGGVTNNGIADPEFFLRSRLWYDDKQLVSIQPLIKLPSYFQEDAPPRGGSKSVDGELSLLYGRSLNWFSDRDYLDMRLGYRARSQGLHAQYKADAALGLSPFDHWQIIPAIRYLKAQKIDDSTAFTQTGDLDYDLLKGEVTVAYKFDGGDWLQASYFRHLSGKQTGSGSGASLGYAIRF